MNYKPGSLNVPTLLSSQHERPLQEQLVPRKKGKHASSTENRRMVWENVVWPLVLEINRSYFSLTEYHRKRDAFCKESGVAPSKVAGGFVSLLIKNIISRDKDIYSIHYRLIPYMRKKAPLEYGLLIREVNTKR
jgi:hypothetical protein